ncbi:hypothetical protein PXO_01434 [Xanthomonas oryzae pv. oryzae PXO99A]|uniref:Uncharacterized protein n=1 Tax=Xanthomonas oryzae pv. oryzae (strain PXO99A) TaxID=360094 RepID=A0A0K0GME9_XANOP|nr:hypothetical protein PXO_01434 [Xanthomonas oryzae pv. oryzae PXO99A]
MRQVAIAQIGETGEDHTGRLAGRMGVDDIDDVHDACSHCRPVDD